MGYGAEFILKVSLLCKSCYSNYALFLLAFVRLKTLLQFFGDDCVCLPPFLYSTFVVGFSILLFSFYDGSAVPLNVNSIALCLPVGMVSNRPLERLR